MIVVVLAFEALFLALLTVADRFLRRGGWFESPTRAEWREVPPAEWRRFMERRW